MSSDLTKLIAAGESETFEFRSAGSHIDSLGKSVCAMLNQQGGVILWGVSDAGEVVGVPDAEVRAHELNQFIARNITPQPLFSVSVSQQSGKQLIVIDVPQTTDKPYSMRREIWVRVGQSVLKASTDESARLVQQSASRLERWEREPLPGFGMDDCDAQELATARTEVVKGERFGIEVPTDDDDFLRRLELTHYGQLTNAAAVLFAKSPRAWAPNLALRLVSYISDKSGPIGNDTICEGPAIRVLKEAITIIQQRTGFSGEFESDKIERQDLPAYPLFALREGLVNAMVHRDYAAVGGSLRVEIFPDHLIIRNPGKLPEGWTTDDLKKTHGSHPGNPDIARVFYLRVLMEQLGMGTQKLIAECKKLRCKQPVWLAEQNTVSLTLFRAPEPEIKIELSERHQQFLESTEPGHAYKVSDYTETTGVSERQARRELAELQRFGLVKKQGKGPATAYVRTEKPQP